MEDKMVSPTMENKKALIEGISQSGFLLEWKVADILGANGFVVEQNLLLKSSFRKDESVERLVEIDVFAREERVEKPGDAYVIECKGAASGDKVVLVPTPKKTHSIPSIYFEPQKVNLVGRENIFCDNASPDLPAYCHTGDFFNYKEDKKQFVRSAKQDDRNNLYKGVCQIYDALDALFLSYTQSAFKVIPTIVTTAEIHVVKFNLAELAENQIDTRVVPWAAYQNPMVYPPGSWISASPWTSDGDRDAKAYADLYRIPAIWIVNLNYLKKFLFASGKSYRGVM